ncbi:hypothetical protein [Corynebacterium sp. ES2775-CONJ]|uniref:hypothetical protein n=1 Tax=Corynebacterium sp. ES2775-CONJ TaxID=2974029 RepID=UPI002169CEFA|nr:hypothetical protein [Corynebacterium sp. ES2775-CONJ]MCS4490323.1 hypothetical protein [Corynebacterium sp. ES2775-CONJ]
MDSVYRVAIRAMAATTGYRTLYPAIIPPGAKHVHGVLSFTHPNLEMLAVAGAVMSSFPCDFVLRAIGTANIFGSTVESLPTVTDPQISWMLVERYLRLCALTEAYAELWEACIGKHWSPDTPVRVAQKRLQLQTEIDALVGIAMGLDVEDLVVIYRSQFPVMRRYDRENLYDRNGRAVPKDIAKACQEHPSAANLTWTHPQSGETFALQPPFGTFDREGALTDFYESTRKLMG